MTTTDPLAQISQDHINLCLVLDDLTDRVPPEDMTKIWHAYGKMLASIGDVITGVLAGDSGAPVQEQPPAA